MELRKPSPPPLPCDPKKNSLGRSLIIRHVKDLAGGVAIAALLGAVIATVRAVLPAPRGAEYRMILSDFRAIRAALKAYQATTGALPTTEQGLDALVKYPTIHPVPKEWIQVFDAIPRDPWMRCYQYRLLGESGNRELEIWTFGKDGKPATKDDISSRDK